MHSSAYSHLILLSVIQNVYKLFLMLLEMRKFDVPTAKTCLDSKFVENVSLGLHVTCMHSLPHRCQHTQMLELFDSEDSRERDYLKTLLHRLYSKRLHLRPFIRQTVNNIFHKYVPLY